MLIPFAGQDPEERAIEVSETKYLFRKTHTRPAMAYRMFRMGKDTEELAERFKRDESTILRWITMERCRTRGLSDPFERKAKASSRILVVQGVRGVRQ